MKILIILFISLIISSCNYKLISPYCTCGNLNTENNNTSAIGANSTEDEIKAALENNKKEIGKNIIVVNGYISSSSDIFDKIKKVIKNEKDIIIDLSNASLDNGNAYTFEGTSALISFILPSTEIISANFFKDCTSLTSISIPSSLEKIDASSFSGCTALKNIEYKGTSPYVINASPFTGNVKPDNLYLPNVSSNPNDKSWDNFLGAAWSKINYGISMPK